MVKKYLIAGFVLEVDFAGDEYFEQRLTDYETSPEQTPDIRVKADYSSGHIPVRQTNLVKLSDIAYYYKEGENDVIFYHDPKLSKTIAKISFSKNYNDISVTVYALKHNHGVEDNMLFYNLMGNIMTYTLQMHSGFVFHSSTICCDGFGVAFSALSGTGKSTHTSLWLKEFPGSFILNDDTPIIALGKDGTFYICGTPWAGTTGINRNYTVPLKAIVFLERAADNSIERINTAQAIKPFFEGIRTPLTDDMFSNCLNTLNLLFNRVPLCRLKCNMDPSAAHVAKDFIFNSL